jgi:putative (di)nucleoside polyphosphate hydrolase
MTSSGMSGGARSGPAGALATRYRRGVGAVVFSPAGRVLVAERRDTPGAWQFPQGGIDGDEDARTAVLREVNEEIGTTEVAVLAETDEWLRYDLPQPLQSRLWRGRYLGQEQKWFALRFLGSDDSIRLDAHPPAEFVRWRWQDLHLVPDAVVEFKRPLYRVLVERFRCYAEP